MEKDQLDEELIALEIERIELLFMKENYDKEDKINYISFKKEEALKSGNLIDIEICDRLLSRM